MDQVEYNSGSNRACNFKSASRSTLVRFWNFLCDYFLNCTLLGPITITNNNSSEYLLGMVNTDVKHLFLQMVELIAGSGVFLYKSQLAMCKSSCKSRSSLACQLLRVFFTDEQLINGKLSNRAGGDELFLLDPNITNIIKGNIILYININIGRFF